MMLVPDDTSSSAAHPPLPLVPVPVVRQLKKASLWINTTDVESSTKIAAPFPP
jgi:hypothetical protein